MLPRYSYEGDRITDRLLGKTFERTHVRRSPQRGEFYECERTIGVAMATQDAGPARNILRIVEKNGC